MPPRKFVLPIAKIQQFLANLKKNRIRIFAALLPALRFLPDLRAVTADFSNKRGVDRGASHASRGAPAIDFSVPPLARLIT